MVFDFAQVSLTFCPGYTKQVLYRCHQLGIASDNLVATVSSPDVSNFANNSCVPTTTQTIGATDCSSFDVGSGLSSPSQIQLVNPLGTTADVTIAWNDGSLVYASTLCHLTGL